MKNRTESKYTDSRFMALLESAPDSMVIAGGDGRIIMINRQTELLFGYSREEIVGREVEILIPEKYHRRHMTERNAYIAEPHTRPMGIGLELYGRKKDGSEFPVEVSLSPMQLDSEETMIIAAIRDVTKQKQDKSELSKRTEELEVINRELEAFSYSVSHDLRAPLRSIEGFSNKILKECADDLDHSGRDYLNRIVRASRHMGVLIDSLLKLARISRLEMQPEYIDISVMAQTISSELLSSDPQRKADFRIQQGINACADFNLIRIALQNLFDNAWKYCRKRDLTVIEFGRHLREGHTVYFIRDNGVGFNMKYAGNLFNAFQRLHTSTEFEGTGVGLATVRRIIERHRGRIWAESEENAGTAFYFTLFSKS